MNAGKPGATGIVRIINAASYSWRGLRAAWKNEAAFRQESVLAVLLVPVAVYFAGTGMELALLIGSLLLVLVVELLNSAIEAVVDRIGPEFHPLAGQAKDMGSAAVLLALLMAFIIWLAVLC